MGAFLRSNRVRNLGHACHRTQHLADRWEMMQRWADYLDRLAGFPINVTG